MTKNLQIIDQRRAEGGKSVATKRTDKIIDQCEFIRLNPRVRVINQVNAMDKVANHVRGGVGEFIVL